MPSSEYNPILLEHYRHPRNSDILKKPDAKARKLNPLCGDEIEVFLKLGQNRIREMKYQARGCAITVASASLLSEKLPNLTVKDLTKLKLKDVEKLLHAKISPARESCATLALEAVKEALNLS